MGDIIEFFIFIFRSVSVLYSTMQQFINSSIHEFSTPQVTWKGFDFWSTHCRGSKLVEKANVIGRDPGRAALCLLKRRMAESARQLGNDLRNYWTLC